MDSGVSDDYQSSDSEIDEKTHANLIKNVLNLTSKQHVKKATRTEPTSKVSEYALTKSGTDVDLNELTDILKYRSKQVEIGKKVRATQNKAKTLPKPLEKPQADRIRRNVAYDSTVKQLDRWEPIVTSLRSAVQVKYPLKQDYSFDNKEKPDIISNFRLKSDLQKRLEKVEPIVEIFKIEDEENKKFPLTLEEILEKRKETAKLRARQSHLEAKARRQSKIKSKRYRRIERHEKAKQNLKDFELLQKTDPEAALKKLDEIEKARAEERISLRHKTTGKWAKNKQIRAKYDKDSRKALAEQLTISRDLTQKLKNPDSESDVEDETTQSIIKPGDQNNPWVSGMKVTKEVEDFVSGYRKYWEEKNINKVHQESPEKNREGKEINGATLTKTNPGNCQERIKLIECDSPNKAKLSNRKRKVPIINVISDIKIKPKKKAVSTSEWEVSDSFDVNIDKEFKKLDNKRRKEANKKYAELKESLKMEKKGGKSIKAGKKYKPDLNIPTKALKPIIDEELNETIKDKEINNDHDSIETLKSMLKAGGKEKREAAIRDIDPNKFLNVKTTILNSAIPDLLSYDDNEEDNQREVITEAFENDDIVDHFQNEKQTDVNDNTPKDIDLSLPGWGSWGGKDINISARKKRRFMIKFPKKMPRKDGNKGNLIINENADKKIKEHLVSELPFPFKTVKDFEASIRAPIGRTFVPETAHRKLIQPAVITKMGVIIEPMNENILLKDK